MKYYIAGQKKEYFFSKRENRVLTLGIGFVLITAFDFYVFDFYEALLQIFWTILFFGILEFFLSKMPKEELVMSLEITENAIKLYNYDEKNDQVISISDIKSIDRSQTEIVINKGEVNKMIILFVRFSYSNIQSIKAELEEIITRVKSSRTIGDKEILSV
ncbi:MAG: hypothetical protein CVV25_02820 [Ignavibacteriae bacterium HGW-Ignavibacteriae-4]|jgi:hypothetical protein|nr:MAG: hypothetical protein CVV25_02820 [Ignavibacteriae bacterium HGW-Ignavibacteriae-4]